MIFDEGALDMPGGKQYHTVLAHVLATAGVVFGRDVAGHDNFFDLGGDSITGTDLVMRLDADFGLKPDLTDLVTSDDLAHFARLLLQDLADPPQAT